MLMYTFYRDGNYGLYLDDSLFDGTSAQCPLLKTNRCVLLVQRREARWRLSVGLFVVGDQTIDGRGC